LRAAGIAARHNVASLTSEPLSKQFALRGFSGAVAAVDRKEHDSLIFLLEYQLVSVAEKRQPPHVILSDAKNLSHIEILRYAQDDKTGFRDRNQLQSKR
jgi:hypothetical protein